LHECIVAEPRRNGIALAEGLCDVESGKYIGLSKSSMVGRRRQSIQFVSFTVYRPREDPCEEDSGFWCGTGGMFTTRWAATGGKYDGYYYIQTENIKKLRAACTECTSVCTVGIEKLYLSSFLSTCPPIIYLLLSFRLYSISFCLLPFIYFSPSLFYHTLQET
jgi:hypothetical protein